MERQNDDASMVLSDKPMTAWEAVAAMGIDMSLIELSLSLTPDQRVYQHDCALRTVLMLQDAAKERHG